MGTQRFILALAAAALVLSIGGESPVEARSSCGDGVCAVGETEANCPADCQAEVVISAPTTAAINTSLAFTSSAWACVPAANGWAWTHSGSGASTTDSISISFAKPGVQSISVSNSGCSDAADNHVVFIEAVAGDFDADGAAHPLTDGVLFMRYVFGFRGGALIIDAVGADCTRCDPAGIEAAIQSIL